MMSSAMPSAKNSCSGSPDMLVNGSTAIEGLSGSGSGSSLTVSFSTMVAVLTGNQRQTWTGLAMFLTSPETRVRSKMLGAIETQIAAAKADAASESYTKLTSRYTTNEETGEWVRRDVPMAGMTRSK